MQLYGYYFFVKFTVLPLYMVEILKQLKVKNVKD